jgi:hypothetical protein
LNLLGSKTRPSMLSSAAKSFFILFCGLGATAFLLAWSNLLSSCYVAVIQNGPTSVATSATHILLHTN